MTAPATVVGPVEVGPIAHGGHCVARLDGRVIFVRHALPGEVVTITLTDTSQRSYWRGDVADVVQASPDRVPPPCGVAGRCGGCDFQHVSLPAQRALKTAVVREQLSRLAGVEWPGEVQAVPFGDAEHPWRDDGLGWRTRMRYVTEPSGQNRSQVGLRAHRSHEVVDLPADGCAIALGPSRDELQQWAAGHDEILVAVGEQTSVLADGVLVAGPAQVRERVDEREFSVPVDGFWQVHPAAPETLTAAVLAALNPQPGEQAFDLYCGVGLFAAALNAAGVSVLGVEYDRRAVAVARTNVPGARFVSGRLEAELGRLPGRTDLVVLDPPRAGAGRKVVAAVAARNPRAIALVACDPASLARDLGLFAEQGYRLVTLQGFDLFPMTHHVECVAQLEPAEDRWGER